MNGQYKTVKKDVYTWDTSACFQEQDVYDQYVFKWYYLMKCVLDLIAYHRKKHYHGLMTGDLGHTVVKPHLGQSQVAEDMVACEYLLL